MLAIKVTMYGISFLTEFFKFVFVICFLICLCVLFFCFKICLYFVLSACNCKIFCDQLVLHQKQFDRLIGHTSRKYDDMFKVLDFSIALAFWHCQRKTRSIYLCRLFQSMLDKNRIILCSIFPSSVFIIEMFVATKKWSIY